jgi:DNA-binding Xre family transcriptional regulator
MRINRKKLDFALARKKWTQGDLAAAIGMSLGGLYQQIGKPKNVLPITVGKIAEALGVPVEEIGI